MSHNPKNPNDIPGLTLEEAMDYLRGEHHDPADALESLLEVLAPSERRRLLIRSGVDLSPEPKSFPEESGPTPQGWLGISDVSRPDNPN